MGQIQDDEVRALNACIQALDKLGTRAQERVLNYLSSRFDREAHGPTENIAVPARAKSDLYVGEPVVLSENSSMTITEVGDASGGDA